MGQFLRFVSLRQQMGEESVSVQWLKVAPAKLGNCGTSVTLTSPKQLSFVRRSSLGFTAFELSLLADWLESPDFPRGFHSQAHSDYQPVPKIFEPKNSPAPPGSPHP
jgi:hypothetical protein